MTDLLTKAVRDSLLLDVVNCLDNAESLSRLLSKCRASDLGVPGDDFITLVQETRKAYEALARAHMTLNDAS